MDKQVIPATPGVRLRIETQRKQEKPGRLVLELVGWSQSENDEGRLVLLPIVWGYRSHDTGQAEILEDVIAHRGIHLTGVIRVRPLSRGGSLVGVPDSVGGPFLLGELAVPSSGWV